MLESKWQLKKLDEVLKVVRGSSPRPIKNYITNDIDGVNWVKIGDVGENEKYVTVTNEKITLKGAEKSRFVDVGDFIFSNSMSFGRAYIMKIPGYIHDGWFTFKLPPELDSHYLWYIFKSPYLIKQIKELASGAIVQNISSDLIKKCLLPIPPLEEQQTIVSKLDQAFAAIDQAKANIEKNIANAKELFQSKLNQIFSQKGEGWEEFEIGKLCDLKRGHNPPKSNFVYEPKEGYVRFYQIRDGSSEKHAVYVPDTPKLQRVEPNEILMVAYRHVGRAFRGVSGCFNVALCKISNKNRSILNDDYLFYIIPTDFVRGELLKQSERSLIPSMSIEHLRILKIPVPDIEIQNKIVKQLDQLQEQTNLLVSKYQQKLANLEELKKSILEKAFKGELV